MSDANTSSGVGVDDLVVSRDETGVIRPVEQYVDEFDDTVVVVPMNNAAQEKYIQPFIEALTAASAIVEEDVDVSELSDDEREELESMGRDALSSETQAELFEEHVVEPDLVAAYASNRPDKEIDGLDADFVDEELKPGAQDGLLFGILLASEMDELVDALRGVVEQDEDEEDTAGNE